MLYECQIFVVEWEQGRLQNHRGADINIADIER